MTHLSTLKIGSSFLGNTCPLIYLPFPAWQERDEEEDPDEHEEEDEEEEEEEEDEKVHSP